MLFSLDCHSNSSLIGHRIASLYLFGKCAILTLIGFWEKRDFSISVFLRGFCGNKTRNDKNYRDAFVVGLLKCGNHQLKKTGGLLWESFLLIWTILVFFRWSTLQLFPFSAETKLEMVLPVGGGGLGSELLRAFTPNSEMPPNNGTRFVLIFWFLLLP